MLVPERLSQSDFRAVEVKKFDHIFLTDKGIRLIDVGISAFLLQVEESLFNRFALQAQWELEVFNVYFFER
jgi:hypothetical protein